MQAKLALPGCGGNQPRFTRAESCRRKPRPRTACTQYTLATGWAPSALFIRLYYGKFVFEVMPRCYVSCSRWTLMVLINNRRPTQTCWNQTLLCYVVGANVWPSVHQHPASHRNTSLSAVKEAASGPSRILVFSASPPPPPLRSNIPRNWPPAIGTGVWRSYSSWSL